MSRRDVLVQEEQKFRLASKLNTNGQPLARLDAQTQDKRVRELLKLEKLDHLLYVGILLGERDMGRLTQVCRKLHRLTDSRCPFVDVHLLG